MQHFRGLPAAEKRELVEQMWKEFGEVLDRAEENLTPEQAAELDRRWAEFEANPNEGIPWGDVKADVNKRFGWG